MGTRHLQTVINKNGAKKISQYGQWDGYPEGQGIDILKFLRNADMERYYEKLEKVHEITKEEKEAINGSLDWAEKYPYLSRDCGSKIHQMILDGQVKFVRMCNEKEAQEWCEGFYTIDFSSGEFTSEYYSKKQTYKLTDLPTDEQYLIDMQDEEE